MRIGLELDGLRRQVHPPHHATRPGVPEGKMAAAVRSHLGAVRREDELRNTTAVSQPGGAQPQDSSGGHRSSDSPRLTDHSTGRSHRLRYRVDSPAMVQT